MLNGSMRPTSVPARSVAVRALLSRSPSTRISSRVESSPRRRGRIANGPEPTAVIPGASSNASPVDEGARWTICSVEMVSVRTGTSSVSRSLRVAVTVAGRRPEDERQLERVCGVAHRHGPRVLREAVEADGEPVDANRQGTETEAAVLVGRDRVFGARGDVVEHHLRAGQGHARGVGCGSNDVGRQGRRGEHEGGAGPEGCDEGANHDDVSLPVCRGPAGTAIEPVSSRSRQGVARHACTSARDRRAGTAGPPET